MAAVRSLRLPGTVLLACLAAACGREKEMVDLVEMPDTAAVHRAMVDDSVRDALLDTMPAGEMARGDSAAEMELLKRKM